MGWPICTTRSMQPYYWDTAATSLTLPVLSHQRRHSGRKALQGMQVVAEYIMVVDPSHGMLEGSTAAGTRRAAGSAPRKAADRGPRIAEQFLRLYNEGHPPHAIAQMLVSSSGVLDSVQSCTACQARWLQAWRHRHHCVMHGHTLQLCQLPVGG